MYTATQKQSISSIVNTQQNIAAKYKTDLIQQLGRLVATVFPNREDRTVLKNGTPILIRVNFMEELTQDRVTFTEITSGGAAGRRIPYKEIPLSDIEALFKKLSKIS